MFGDTAGRREDLQRKIWADGTFVDFDQSLNRAVNKVREALGDSAENPRFIETMARRGYRFIAPVEGAPRQVAPTASQVPAAGRPWGKIAWVAAGVVAAAGAGLWLTGDRAPLPPPRLVPLTTYPGSEGIPALSPDGKDVAFAWEGEARDNTDVYVKLVGNVTPLRLTSDPAYDGFPAWSPDGRQIAFVSGRDGGGLYLVSKKGGGWDVWVVEASGSSPRQLTHGPADNVIPSWSRDGSSTFLASRRSGRFEIWRMPAGGGTAEQVTRNGGHTAFESTDGKTLYYTLSDGGAEGLYAKVLPDGEEKQVLKEGVARRGFAVFSDGVFYIHGRSRNSFEIRFHEFAGGPTQLVGDVGGPLGLGLAASPDRKTFLFSKFTDGGSDLMLIENFR